MNRTVIYLLPLFVFCYLPITSYSQIVVIGETVRERQSLIGREYRGAVVLKNRGTEKAECRLYSRDYSFSSYGSTFYGDPGTSERSNAGWITFHPEVVTLEAEEEQELRYTVSVPYDRNLLGTYWSILFVENVPQNSSDQTGERKGVRYGIEMVTNIGVNPKAQLAFFNAKLVGEEEEERTFQIDLLNTGEKWLQPLLYIELYDMEGNFIGKFDGGQYRLYPDTSKRGSVSLQGVKKGTYKALVIADCGEGDLFGGNYTIVLKK